MKKYWVYILCSERNGALYIGITGNLRRRIYEHRMKMVPGFTARYNIDKLVHVEEFSDVQEAIHREKCIKKWNRLWKLHLIEENNPDWVDYYDTIHLTGIFIAMTFHVIGAGPPPSRG